MLYGAYDGIAGTAKGWGMKPGNLAFAKACTRIFQPDGKEYLQQWLAYQAQRRVELAYRDLFRETGLLVSPGNDVETLFDRAAEHVSPTILVKRSPPSAKASTPQPRGTMERC